MARHHLPIAPTLAADRTADLIRLPPAVVRLRPRADHHTRAGVAVVPLQQQRPPLLHLLHLLHLRLPRPDTTNLIGSGG